MLWPSGSELRSMTKGDEDLGLVSSEEFWIGWLVVLSINVDLAIFQPYLDLEAGDNQSLKIKVARPGIEPQSSCSASQELYYSATAAPRRFGQFQSYTPHHLVSQSAMF